jgi:hypothetical protein
MKYGKWRDKPTTYLHSNAKVVRYVDSLPSEETLFEVVSDFAIVPFIGDVIHHRSADGFEVLGEVASVTHSFEETEGANEHCYYVRPITIVRVERRYRD